MGARARSRGFAGRRGNGDRFRKRRAPSCGSARRISPGAASRPAPSRTSGEAGPPAFRIRPDRSRRDPENRGGRDLGGAVRSGRVAARPLARAGGARAGRSLHTVRNRSGAPAGPRPRARRRRDGPSTCSTPSRTACRRDRPGGSCASSAGFRTRSSSNGSGPLRVGRRAGLLLPVIPGWTAEPESLDREVGRLADAGAAFVAPIALPRPTATRVGARSRPGAGSIRRAPTRSSIALTTATGRGIRPRPSRS